MHLHAPQLKRLRARMLRQPHARVPHRLRVQEAAGQRLHRSDRLHKDAAQLRSMGRRPNTPRHTDQQHIHPVALDQQAAHGLQAAVISLVMPALDQQAAVISLVTPVLDQQAAVISPAMAALGLQAAVISLVMPALDQQAAPLRDPRAVRIPARAVQAVIARRVLALAHPGSVLPNGDPRPSRRSRRGQSPSRRRSSSKTWPNCSRRRLTM